MRSHGLVAYSFFEFFKADEPDEHEIHQRMGKHLIHNECIW